jgi:hypothetical protein
VGFSSGAGGSGGNGVQGGVEIYVG